MVLIKRNFTPLDVEDILEIPLGRRDYKGEIIGDLDPKGIFSVKSAYHLAYNLSLNKEASGSNNEKQ